MLAARRGMAKRLGQESQRSVGEPQREKTSGPILYAPFSFFKSLCHQSFDDYFRVLQCITVNFTFAVVLYFIIIPIFSFFYRLLDTDWPVEWRLNYLRKPVLVMANVACCSLYIPVYLFIKVFNGIWCLDVSNAALRYKDVHAVNFPTFAYDFKGLITLKVHIINKFF